MKSMFMAIILLALVAKCNLFAIESTGNLTLDDFFTNVEKINSGIDTVKGKINRTNAYIIWALNDPNDFNANIATQSYAEASASAAKKYATLPSITLNTASFKTVMTPDNLLIFIAHVTEAQKELAAIGKDADDISKNAQALIDNAKALPAEAKKLSPMKVP